MTGYCFGQKRFWNSGEIRAKNSVPNPDGFVFSRARRDGRYRKCEMYTAVNRKLSVLDFLSHIVVVLSMKPLLIHD